MTHFSERASPAPSLKHARHRLDKEEIRHSLDYERVGADEERLLDFNAEGTMQREKASARCPKHIREHFRSLFLWRHVILFHAPVLHYSDPLQVARIDHER